ncbi:hypothetical protein SDC9_98994 [bioreactor metagenome]|uniref:Uncharacterized protein n=1 Tax=bioreactor metagenome TaxID=1076179 RepID=A0A645AGU1_9ZZZZ
MHHPTHRRHVPVDVGVGGGVGGGPERARRAVVDLGPVEGADDHLLGPQVVVRHTGRFDHEQVGAGHPLGDVAGGPDDQAPAGQFGMQRGHPLAGLGDGAPEVVRQGFELHHGSLPESKVASRRSQVEGRRHGRRRRERTAVGPAPGPGGGPGSGAPPGPQDRASGGRQRAISCRTR